MSEQQVVRQREENLEDSGRFLRDGRRPQRRPVVPVPAPALHPAPSAARPSSAGPRLALAVFALACAAALAVVGVVMDSGVGTWPAHVELVREFHGLAWAIPHIPTGRSTSGLWIMVALGDPRVFVALAVLATVVGLRLGGWRLATLCSVAPAAVMVLDEFVAKPTFFFLNGGHYGFPSGHVTAATTICAVFLLLLSARFGKRVLIPSGLLCVALVGCAMAGVVLRGMHPLKDAIGGALFGAGTMAFLASVYWRPVARRVSRSVRPH